MGSTQPAENRRPQTNRSAPHPAADDIGRLFGVAANHPSMRDIAPPTGKQNSAPESPGKAPTGLQISYLTDDAEVKSGWLFDREVGRLRAELQNQSSLFGRP
jgi:hypothetical protein